MTLEDVPGYPPLYLGEDATWALASDQRQMAALLPAGDPGGPAELHLIDLDGWTATPGHLRLEEPPLWVAFGPSGHDLYWWEGPHEGPGHRTLVRLPAQADRAEALLTVDDPVREVMFGPDGTLYWAHPGEDGTKSLFRFLPERGESRPVAVVPAYVDWFGFLSSGELVGYGTPHGGEDPSAAWPRVMVVHPGRGVIHDLVLEGVRSGLSPSTSNLPEEGQGWYSPGRAWDLERARLYVVHADAERLTVADLREGEVATMEVAPQASALGWFWSWVFPPALAKEVDPQPHSHKGATLSPDGSHLYVTGSVTEVTWEDGDRWVLEERSLDLEVLATDGLTRVATLDLPVTRSALSPDGRTLLLTGSLTEADSQTGWERSGSGLYVLRTAELGRFSHLLPGANLEVMAFSPDGASAYLAEWGDSARIWALDLLDLQVTGERLAWGRGGTTFFEFLEHASVAIHWADGSGSAASVCITCTDELWPFPLPPGHDERRLAEPPAPAIPESEVPDGWVVHRDERRRFTIAHPPHWQRATTSLTPNLLDPTEIVSLATYPLRPGGHSCAHQPVYALEDLGPHDAFVSLQERAGPDAAGFPPRPDRFGPEHGVMPAGVECLARPADFFIRWIDFVDGGRSLYVLVAIGAEASDQTRHEVWQIVNTVTFGPDP